MLFVCRVLLALAAFVSLSVPAPAQPASAEDELIGIWASSIRFGPELQGQLSVSREGSAWGASIGQVATRFSATGAEIRFSFPNNLGGFRGRLVNKDRSIEGFWLQPSGETADRRDPGGSGQPFATPMILRSRGRGIWSGTVVPVEDRFTLYLKVFRNPEGVLAAAFRNPEYNANGGTSQYLVSRDGDRIRFFLKYDGGEISHDAMLLRGPDRLRITWPGLDRTIELSRTTPAAASAFFPRPPESPSYRYRRPDSLADGWQATSGSALGVDEAALTGLVQKIVESDPAARGAPLIHSLVVAYRGKLVLEEYFFGHSRETPHDIRSAGKTFSSILMGAAIMNGSRLSPETKVYDLLSGLGPFANPDPRKSRVTLAHLMTHSAGLACNDYDENSPGNEGTMQSQDQQPDWWKYTLDLPMVHEPGQRYAYCSANTNLMGAVLKQATGTWLPELFDRSIARPLQFGRYHWNLAANDEGYLGGGAFIRPRDLLKIGQTYLDGGIWRGKRIVPAAWVQESTIPRMEISPTTTGIKEEEFGNSYGRGHDGLAWHINPLSIGGRPLKSYEANGNGGQIILVVPEYDLTVVFTGGNYLQGGVWSRWRQQIVGDQIIPALGR
jgi:CubicO group peptidase (beta-lactamase class C family)